MSSKTSTGKNMPSERTPSQPQVGGGGDGEWRDPVANTDDARLARLATGFRDALISGVKRWGGSEALARLWGMDLGDVSRRLNEAPHKGVQQHAFHRWAAIVCTDGAAAEGYLYDLCDLLGFERPKRKRIKTTDEKYAALVRQLRACGPLGEAAIARAASSISADTSEFE